MRNGIAKPNKSQALNKEQKIKRCQSGNSAPLFYPQKSVGANSVRSPLFVNTDL